MIGGSGNVSTWIAVYPFVCILPQRREKGEEMVDKSSTRSLLKLLIKICHLSCASSFYLILSWPPAPLPLCLVSGFFSPANEKRPFIFFLSFFVFPMRKSLEVKKGKRESRRKIKCVDTEGMNGDAKKRIRILHKPPVQKTA